MGLGQGRRRRAARTRPVVERLEPVCLLSTIMVNSVADGALGDNADLPGEVTLPVALGEAQPGDTVAFDIVPGATFTGSDSSGVQHTFTNPSSGPFSIKDGGGPNSNDVTIDGTTQSGFAPGHPQVYLDQGGEMILTTSGNTVKGLGFINHDSGGGPLELEGPGGDTVEGCVFGIDASGQGTTNAEDIDVDSPNNTIGGTTTADRNIIANGDNGMGPGQGILISGPEATGNLIEGNYIGTDLTGTTAFANSAGIVIEGAGGNTIGGTTPTAANVISGNLYGIGMGQASGNVIDGNLIGTNASGQGALPNTKDGIYLLDGGVISIGTQSMTLGPCTGNTIGGTAAGAGNVIADNGNDGVSIQSAPAGSGLGQSTGNAIEENLIYGNTKLGIDLGDTGAAVANNALGHAGPNDYQNFPLVAATSSGTITGILSSPPGTYRVEYFALVPNSNPGEVYLGAQSVTIAPKHQSVTLPAFQPMVPIPAMATVAATATVTAAGDPSETVGDTSELSAGAPPALIVNETKDESLNADGTVATQGELSLREAIQMVVNGTMTGANITFDIPGSGVPVITLDGALPAVSVAGVTLNGTSQSGGMVAVNGGGQSGDGLDLTGGGDTVQGLVIQHFNGNGISISGAGSDTVSGNFIGTDTGGMATPLTPTPAPAS
jgi:hypothetical protein